jgi:hypothetical protein
MNRRHGLTALAVAVLVLSASIAQAQAQRQGRGQGRFGFGGGGPMDPTALLSVEKVQQDLKLEAAQTEKITQIREEMQTAMQELRSQQDLDREQRFAKMNDLRKEATEKINGVLNAQQQERLKQIALQVRGGGALADEAIATELALSDDQKSQITSIREESQQQMQAAMQEARDAGGDFAAIREKMTAMRNEANEKLLGVLNADQKEKFQKMQGEKLALEPADLRGLGGFGGGRRGGGGNN